MTCEKIINKATKSNKDLLMCKGKTYKRMYFSLPEPHFIIIIETGNKTLSKNI